MTLGKVCEPCILSLLFSHLCATDNYEVHPRLIEATYRQLGIKQSTENASIFNITIVRKSFDGRWKKSGQPKFVYTVDVELPDKIAKRAKIVRKEGLIEPIKQGVAIKPVQLGTVGASADVIIVGAGPAGLFAALTLVEAGVRPVIVERGKAVEQRGLSIGALFNRGLLDPESNLCYGEGGAGTWSDGKLTTRIGKNSEEVRSVLRRLVRHGAPERILVDGKPHLGTDRLVRILKVVCLPLPLRESYLIPLPPPPLLPAAASRCGSTWWLVEQSSSLTLRWWI